MEGSATTNDVAMVEIPIAEATQICVTALEKAGYSTSDAETITDHLVDAELRGAPFAGLARALSIIDRLRESGPGPGPGSGSGSGPGSRSRWDSATPQSSTDIEVVSDGASFVRLDGHDAVGYLVARRATELAIEKAKTSGVAVVGANNFWYSGNLAYYAEQATRQDLVCILASNTLPLVAPEGAVEARFGTNPICIGFPTSRVDRPVIWDIGTSNIMHAQMMRAQRLGIDLPEGAAYSKEGDLTTDPAAALEGALTVWGGHKGSGLAVMVQLLGMAAGSSAIPSTLSGFGYLALMFDPAVLRPIEEVKGEADEYGEFHRSARTADGEHGGVRMPFDGSYERRKATTERGSLNVPAKVIDQLRQIGVQN
ncbi:hypothetical protein A1O3_06519 [Capronia epimyces CBS 606.96]|uniref:Malate/L-lactate dehydrogenase n=1 Tax=Capronia epimyces CBS 606.96 TaxID=1182542 RepID=W9XZ89_9EURO|nr:uncharacterized protein A1O3_06519 [Capronia epimyces CBS 606.96]EXJ82705.1 hypothetical protein A1O3_06519 [Capronia epimyces CBS 606.96]